MPASKVSKINSCEPVCRVELLLVIAPCLQDHICARGAEILLRRYCSVRLHHVHCLVLMCVAFETIKCHRGAPFPALCQCFASFLVQPMQRPLPLQNKSKKRQHSKPNLDVDYYEKGRRFEAFRSLSTATEKDMSQCTKRSK